MNFPAIHRLALGALIALSACKDQGPKEIGPPSQIVVVTGGNQSALAATALSSPVQMSVRDANGQGVPEQTITFSVVSGGGVLSTTSAVSDASGTIVLPAWTLGKSAVQQTVRASVGTVTGDVNAVVQTAYNIEIRFFGDPMTPAQQALFTNAAARIRAIVTGDIIDADARNSTINPSQCGVSGQPNFNEIIDDVLIFASIQEIDGPGQILAQAGPCLIRDTPTGAMTAVGVMQFDSADLGTLSGGGSLQEVITHEMLHVLGIGTLWTDRGTLTDAGTANPRYTGVHGIQGCRDVGGNLACATSVPVENDGGSGTVDSHWRESTFNTEMMTGFLDSGVNPISLLTIGGLQDLGFVVNYAAVDAYTIFNNLPFRASSIMAAGSREKWERVVKPIGVLENGRISPVRAR